MNTFRMILIVLLTVCGPVKAFDLGTIRFSHIGINEGLSQNTVFSITQDKTDNMWFATYDGVNKFDGYDFTVYRHNNADTTSIAGNIARVVMTDSKGRIWVGTHKGISLYNRETDCFENFTTGDKKNTLVTHIVELSPDRLLVNIGSKLCVFDVLHATFRTDILPSELKNMDVSAIYKVNETLYVGCVNGKVMSYSLYKGRFSPEKSYKLDAKIQTMLLQNLYELWIGTEGGGLIMINIGNGQRRYYRHTGRPGDISSDYIRSLAVDSNGRLWVGTFNDLNIYKRSSDTFEVYTNDSDDEGSLSQRSVRCIYKDNQGGMWLGTYFGGLNYYHPLKDRFRTIKHEPNRNSLSDNVVSCIVEDEEGGLWIGTNDGGLNYYNPSDGRYRLYLFNDRKDAAESESNNVKSIYIDQKKNRVYVGTHAGGMKIIERGMGSIRHLYVNEKSSAANSVYAILPYNERMLWIGTLDGLYVFDKEKMSFQLVHNPFLSGRAINVMYKEEGRLWIGCEDGIEVFQVIGGKLVRLARRIKGLDEIQMVQAIYKSIDGKVWIATRVGLYCADLKTGKLIHLTMSDGLPNDVIYGIEEDAYNHIWLSTNKGLSCYNPKDGTFRNFTVMDGLQSNQFNTYSHCRTMDGQLFFGGINGITTFRPELLIENPYTPRPVITKLLVFNKEIRPGDETGILKKHISDTDTIILDHSYKSFTLQFVVSNYLSGQHNTFSYKLDGYDEGWTNTVNKRSVSYSNLPHGTYCFRVKAANNDGRWNEEPTVLYIKVLPIWYETWWARILIILGVIGSVAVVLRYIWERKQMEVRLDMEHKDKIRQEEVNQMKMRFFINISHELRTPLSLIIAPIQEMKLRTTDKWMKEQLSFVERNANRLMYIVNQLKDYRRAELGVFKLRVLHCNIYQTVKDCFSFYEKLAKHKSLAYNLISDLEDTEVYADAKYVELILNNLLSNAFKYTQKGSITVNLTLKDNFLLLKVTDTGTGIAKENYKKIFERFTQLDAEHIGSGIGLSLIQRLVELHHGKIELESEVGKGSSFSVWLPQNISCYAEGEIAEESLDELDAHSVNTREMFFLDSELETLPEETTEVSVARGTILVVEDNEEIRHYLKAGLSKVFNVILAENGEVALNLLKENKVDIVITDVMMPVMDGIKLCKHIKQNIATSHIPVIMLSAKTDVSAQVEAFGTGADDYILKPFSMAVVIGKIQNMMRTRQHMIEHYSKELEVVPEKVTFNAMDEDLLRRAVEVVKSNMDNVEFSTEDFAREMNMSRSNLHLKLKAITGESAIEFIKKIRFGEACRLLREGKYNVAEISSMVGFNTPSYFATSFKKYMGCLPTEYLKQQQK